MKAFITKVAYPCGTPRDFKGTMKVNVAFVAEEERVMEAYTKLTGKDFFRVNATAGTPKHAYLKPLKRGQRVYLVKAGTHEEKPYFDLLEDIAPPEAANTGRADTGERPAAPTQRPSRTSSLDPHDY